MPVNVEIERRFILRNLPPIARKYATALSIVQFYRESDEGVIRYRMTVPEKGVNISYEKIIKLPVSKGINTEQTLPITKESFQQEVNDSMRYIAKKRFAFQWGKHKFEFDVFEDIKLVILEVELDNLEEDIIFPDSIKREIIAEITGMKEFSNYNMARVE